MQRPNPIGLAPFVFFVCIFISSGILFGDFYKLPILVAFVITSVFTLTLRNDISFDNKIRTFCRGAGNEDVITMVMIFLLAGVFGEISEAAGCVEAAVHFGLTVLPANWTISGIFVICCLISFAMGSGVGTIVAIVPVGLGLCEKLGISTAPMIGAVVSGAMFGDNISLISDTTIAAVRTQKCEMKDKFKTNVLLVLPAALISIILFSFLHNSGGEELQNLSFDLIALIPYAVILVFALFGVNVFIVLGLGILTASLYYFYNHLDSGLVSYINHFEKGLAGMLNLSILSIISGGLVGLVSLYGGIEFLLEKIKNRTRTKRGAEAAIAGLAIATDLSTANNTVTIVMAGPLVKKISDQFGITPQRSASLIDIFATSAQGIIPYGAQILAAAQMSKLSPTEIVPYAFYPFLMIIFASISIAFSQPFSRFCRSLNLKTQRSTF